MGTRGTDLTAAWAEVWVVCAGQGKTPGETWAGAHGTAGLSWGTDQESSTTPVSGRTEGDALRTASRCSASASAAFFSDSV